jgi:hypothetical protein
MATHYSRVGITLATLAVVVCGWRFFGEPGKKAGTANFVDNRVAGSIEAMRSPVTNEGSEMLKLQALKPESSEAQSGASRSLVDDGADREGLSDEDFARIQPSLAVLQRVQETAEDSGDLTLLARVDEERRRLSTTA